ncbi:TniQ family protein [Shewanella sp. A25]|nr:TniQ family protein [Shewanella shenzhenensis]
MRLAVRSVSPHQAFGALEKEALNVLGKLEDSEFHAEHSLVNYFRSFWPQDDLDWEKAKEANPVVRGGESTHVVRWRWCPLCVGENEARYGLAYFHRNHQLAGVFYCHKHEEALIDSCQACGWRQHRLNEQSFPPMGNTCPDCGAWLEAKPIAMTDTMQRIEAASVRLAHSPIVSDRRLALVRRVRELAGVSTLERNSVAERRLLGVWQKRFLTHFSEYELGTWFRNLNVHRGILCHPMMRSPRLTQISSVAAHPHPLVYLLLEDFLAVTPELAMHG